MDRTPNQIANNFISTIKKRLFVSLIVIIIGFLYLIYHVGKPGSVSIITLIFAFFLAAGTIVFNLLAAEMDREKLYQILFESREFEKSRDVLQIIIDTFPKSIKQSFISTDFYYASALSMLLTGTSHTDIHSYLEKVMGTRINDNGRFKVLYLAHLSFVTNDQHHLSLITPLGKINGLNKQIVDYTAAISAYFNHDTKAMNIAIAQIEDMNVYPLITDFAQQLKK